MSQQVSFERREHAAGNGPLARLRRTLQNRPDSEHEMTINRLVFATLVALFLIAGLLLDDPWTREALPIVGTGTALYMLGAFLLFVHILARPGVSPVRRTLAILLDLITVSYGAYVVGLTMAFFYPLHLWTILGNGFRFGVSYLWIAMCTSFAGLAVAFWASGVWAAHTGLCIGLLSGVVILPLYCSSLIRKLSAAKRQAEEASRAKSLFLASISHELRTPLNVIIGLSDLLRAHKADREQGEMVQMIGTSGRSLLGLINSILDFSRIEAGQMPSTISEFDLHALLGQVRALLGVQAQAKGLRLALFVGAGVPRMLRGDRRHLEEVLVNLTGNAVKFTTRGHVHIRVDVAPAAGGGDGLRLRFEISDTGIGIAPDAQRRIFESFTQADETIIDKFGGTGLGLAVCKQLVELHGGEIGLTSTPGEGSTFWFEIASARAGHPGTGHPLTARLLVLSEDHRLLTLADAMAPSLSIAADIATAQQKLRVLRAESDDSIVVLLDSRNTDMPAEAAARCLLDDDPRQRLALVHLGEAGERVPADRLLAFASAIERPIDPAELHNALLIAEANERGGLGTADEPEPAPVTRRPLSVLVAEDNKTNQMVITKILQRAGHEVTMASNGEEALERLRAGGIDIVLMDINMPVMNGIEATKLYRFISVGRERIPIIALTADATPEARARCEEAGMDACMTKPIDAAILLRTLDELAAGGGRAPSGEDERIALIEDHPRFQTAAPGGLNLTTLEELSQLGGRDFVGQLVEQFTSEAHAILIDLQKAVAEDNIHAFGERIHALRSCAANIGAQSVFERCVAWRQITVEELANRGEDYLALLKADFAAAATHLDAFVKADRKRSGAA